MDAATIYARRWWMVVALCFSLLIIGMDLTILNVALPTLAKDLHAGTSSLQWMVDAYTLVYASMLLTTGSLGDRFGRKGALNTGLVIFGLGSLASAFSGSANLLIACRAVMGLGGCLIMPATLSILTNVFTDHRERAKAIGFWAAVAGLGIVAGPTIGGILLQHFWWGSVFLINVPVVAIALIAGKFVVPTSKDPNATPLDPVGTVLSVVGLSLVLYAIIEAPTVGMGSSTVIGTLLAGLAVVGGFVAWELHSDHPMLDVRFFEDRRFTAASLTITLAFFALNGLMFFLTQYLQSVLGYSTLSAGLALIPVGVAMAIAAPSSAKIDARLGSKVTVVVGMAIAAAGVGVLALARAGSPYTLVALALGLLGIGGGLVMTPATNSIMGSLPLAKAGVGSAVNDTTRQVGGALGVAILGSIASALYRSKVAATASFAALPSAARSVVRAGIGNVAIVRHQLPAAAGALSAQLKAQSSTSFVGAMHFTAVVCSVFVLLGALVALIWLPARADDDPAAARRRGVAPELADPAQPLGEEVAVPVAAVAGEAVAELAALAEEPAVTTLPATGG
ncbi:MAG TPA: DHA2 family efflux MFS transporter permease subunit [Actinomycetota bacterium]|nr:DHA2 family efflux MFS transporter permease subunit [Actinomycetota bacterium]